MPGQSTKTTVGLLMAEAAIIDADTDVVREMYDSARWVMSFPTGVDSHCTWLARVPGKFVVGSDAFTCSIWWARGTGSGDTVIWNVSVEKLDGQNPSVDGYDLESQIGPIGATANQLYKIDVTIPGDERDGIVAGEAFRLKLEREGSNVLDDLTVAAHVLAVGLQAS